MWCCCVVGLGLVLVRRRPRSRADDSLSSGLVWVVVVVSPILNYLVRSSWLLSVRRAREPRRGCDVFASSLFVSWSTFAFRSINANRVRCGAR